MGVRDDLCTGRRVSVLVVAHSMGLADVGELASLADFPISKPRGMVSRPKKRDESLGPIRRP